MMTVLHNQGRWDKSNVRFERSQIVLYDKKKTDPAMAHIDYGLSLIRRDLAVYRDSGGREVLRPGGLFLRLKPRWAAGRVGEVRPALLLKSDRRRESRTFKAWVAASSYACLDELGMR